MNLDKSTKTKIIIFASLGVAIILVIMLFVGASYSNKEGNSEVSVRATTDTEDLTIADILESEQGGSSDYESPEMTEARRNIEESYNANDDEEILRLQEQLRANQSVSAQQPDYSYTQPKTVYTAPSAPRNIASSAPAIEESPQNQEIVVSEEESEPETTRRRFFGSQEETDRGNAIQAKVYGTQQVQSGGTLKMILSEDITVAGKRIKKGTPIYGRVELNNNRLQVQISSIRVGNNIHNFTKTVYDRDGMPGIYIPDNSNAEIANDARSTAVSSAHVGSTGSTVVDGAVQVVESVAKGAVSKRASRPVITIKSNYKLLLK